jgi:acyl transferase domain-containing protein/acyl carrier protein
MSLSADRIAQLSPKRLALLALELERRVAAGPSSRVPIAIIGIGCRLPGGVSNPDEFWDLLAAGRDAVSDVPSDRWTVDDYYDPDPDTPGTMNTRGGGFLEDIRGFDAAFFGISPREATSMDPQQRILLEVGWEALEHAGIAPSGLNGSLTGVFVGICNHDYLTHVMNGRADLRDAYAATGNAASVAAGRLSYVLGLRGPSLAIDTACSSSLVAVHLACQSLQLGESRLALAGGVNVIASPETTILLSKAHMMAPDARCKAFDARADGFVRGEGCALVALKRLPDAIADGDRVLAIIRGSAVNQDGRSSGITAPNGPSQEAVIRAALASAAASPGEIGYVEAHGTGTALGDPIEMRALGAVFGAVSDRQGPLVVGSVKTNIGHLESAAGVAGLVKTVLALQHRWIPPHLHFSEPSPHIDWERLPVLVPTNGRAWDARNDRRLAGISSFGFSGTNAHVILEEAPAPEPAAPETTGLVQVLALSARSESALTVTVERFLAATAARPEPFADVCFSANTGRAAMAHRVAVSAATLEEARTRLASWRAGETVAQVAAGTLTDRGAPRIVFLFSGQGAQYPGMTAQLYQTERVFRDALDLCADLLDEHLETPLRDVLYGGRSDLLQRTEFVQPALFAVEYALAAMWRRSGVEPSCVVGHSIGEFAAACVAGVLSLEDASRLVAARGRLMQRLPPDGGMLAVFAAESVVTPHLAGLERLSIAALNAADEMVVSGPNEELERLRHALTAHGVDAHPLRVSHAFHSALVDPVLDEFEHVAASMPSAPPVIPWVSTLTGREIGSDGVQSMYWRQQARGTVRFADAITRLADQDCVFLEVGPGRNLLALAKRSASARHRAWLPSVRNGRPEREEYSASLAILYTHGASIDWTASAGDPQRRRVPLPTYPFQHVPYFVADAGDRTRSKHAGVSKKAPGRRLDAAIPTFELELNPETPEAPVHRMGEASLLAAPFYIHLAAAAVAEVGGERPTVFHDIEFVAPLPCDIERVVQTVVRIERGTAVVEIYSAAAGSASRIWVQHARLTTGVPTQPVAVTCVEPSNERFPERMTGDAYRERLQQAGFANPDPRGWIQHVWCGPDMALARVELPADEVGWSPHVLDAVMLVAAAARLVSSDQGPSVMAGIGELRLLSDPASPLWIHARLDGDPDRVSMLATADDGRAAMNLERMRLARAVPSEEDRARELFHDIVWREAPAVPPAAPTSRPSDASARLAFEALSAANGMAIYSELTPALDGLATEYARLALDELGLLDVEGRLVASRIPDARARIVPAQERLFDHLLGWLASDVEPSAGRETIRERVLERHAAAERRFVTQQAELRLLRRCGPLLTSMLTGEGNPLDALFGEPAVLQDLYEHSPAARTFNHLVAQLVSNRAPVTGPLRVLEVGAGTGATSASVLPRLRADRTRYVFTDVSAAFLSRAKARFRDYPSVEYRLFDVERNGASQGFERASFDVVVAANAVHAAADLPAALGHLRELLASGGMLVLVEGVAPRRWVDLTFGLTTGWWRHSGRDGRTYPLVSVDTWRTLLGDAGFDPVAFTPGDGQIAEQVLISATAPPVHEGSPVRNRQWVVVSRGGALADALVERAHAREEPALVVSDATDITGTLAALSPAAETTVVVLNDDASAPDPATAAIERCNQVRTLLRSSVTESGRSVRIWLATTGAQAVHSDDVPRIDQAALWGLGQVAALEQPAVWGGLIDLDPGGLSAITAADALIAEISGAGTDDRVAYRGGRRWVPRLIARMPYAAPRAEIGGPGRSWLVTGGLGALGARVAEWLAGQGILHLVLLGRQTPDRGDGTRGNAEAQRRLHLVASLTARGVTVETVAADVADAGEMELLLSRFGRDWPPLYGVVHAAAVFGSAPLVEMDDRDLAEVVRPKVAGAWHLHRFAPPTVEHFVLFSSTAAFVGGVGQGHYAAANASLGALAQLRRRQGRPALAIDWGLWEDMRHTTDAARRQYDAIGLRPMAADVAVAALHVALRTHAARCCIAATDWRVLRTAYLSRRPQPILDEIAVDAAPATTGRFAPSRTATEAPAPLSLHRIRRHIADILQMPTPDAVPPDRGLFDLGMDSLMSVELKNRLERDAGRRLPSTIVFNHPSARALTDFLVTPHSSSPAEPGAAATLEQLSERELADLLSKSLEHSS